jgi:hypothetical protein
MELIGAAAAGKRISIVLYSQVKGERNRWIKPTRYYFNIGFQILLLAS